VVISPNLPSAEDLNLADIIGRKYSLPTYMLNDANAAALGEKSAGKGKDLESFILLTLGTGIGGGIIFRHELMDVPAEIGHMTIVPEGRECDCGNHGCLEEYAAAKALINMATSAIENGTKSSLGLCCEGNIYKITPELIYKHAMNGDMLARDILKTAGKYLGIAIANLANIFYPSAFILAGGLSNAWNIYVEEAIREADKRAMPGLFDKDTVFRSEIYEDAGLIGVALYSLFT
ncbi:MAG TPA: ROK family protein, partial [Nitrospirae bacterium]|nr:ROK family protein [Nitrospirota bacterium]